MQLDAAPESSVNIVVEGTRLRIYFDYEQDTQTDEDGNAIENCYKCENVDLVGTRSYGSIISAVVASKYSNDDVTAIMANKGLADDADSDITDEKRTEYLQDYSDFQSWRAHAKEVAKEAIALLDA